MGGRRELHRLELISAEHELRAVLMKLSERDDGPFYRYVTSILFNSYVILFFRKKKYLFL